MVLEPLETNEVVITSGGLDQVRDLLQGLQETISHLDLDDSALTYMNVLGTTWRQELIQELDSLLGQCGETDVEAAFLPIRSLVRVTVKKLPQEQRSYFCYPCQVTSIRTY